MPGPTQRLIRLRRALLAILALSGGVTLPAWGRTQACAFELRAEMPLTILRNFMLVPAALDGGRVMMVVDTGAEATTVTPETVEALGLAWVPGGPTLLGVGGEVRGGGSVRLRRIELGGWTRSGLDLGVGRLPHLAAARPVAGLLGVDVLGGYDLDLDLRRRSIAIYAGTPCPGFVPPGFSPADGHDLHRGDAGLLFVSVLVDGHAVRALLDTGARSSLVSRRAAAGLGVTNSDLDRDPVVAGVGVGRNTIAFRRHRFREVRMGELARHDMTVNIAALPIAGVDMLLGADWLAGRRAWISRAAGRLFLR